MSCYYRSNEEIEKDVKELRLTIRDLIKKFESSNHVNLTDLQYKELPNITANSKPEKWVFIAWEREDINE